VKVIILDSSPLSLLTHRVGVPTGDACRDWLAIKRSNGSRFLLPEIVDYELRRELLRLGKSSSLRRLDDLVTNGFVDFIPINSTAIGMAAQLWATSRRAGLPTADRHALDIDVILCAQGLTSGFDPAEMIVATSNVRHLSQFIAAAIWSSI